MIVEKIKLVNFRNYDKCEILFNQGRQLFIGKNAQGKTNLIEALYYVSTIRSHRDVKDIDLLKHDTDSFVIEVEFIKNGNKKKIKIVVSEKGKQLFIFNTHIKKVSEFIGNLNVILFCPDDLMLFQAPPKIHRRFIDIELSKISKSYLNILLETKKGLKERNAYLKANKSDDYLEVLNEILIRKQIKIIKQRKEYINLLEKKCQNLYYNFEKDGEILTIKYDSCINFNLPEEKWEKELINKYKNSYKQDLLWKQTTVGIHKENIRFFINNKDAAVVASQGQKRSIILAIKLSLIEIIYEIDKEYPILLLDDVFSELDKERQLTFIKLIPKNIQTFITASDSVNIEELKELNIQKKWIIDSGMILEEEML